MDEVAGGKREQSRRVNGPGLARRGTRMLLFFAAKSGKIGGLQCVRRRPKPPIAAQ
jgi:hypothetical protein